MATLEGIEIFATGEWNGQEFATADLDDIELGFDEEQLAGRLPVKLGHSAPDTEPARGWISRVWREGDRLLATLSDVPQDVVDGIKSGAWRHVSVELLKGVTTAAGRTYRYLLDGLALLGAARPAVSVLKPLHESMSGKTCEQRLAFVTALPGRGSDPLRQENARLRAALHRQSIDAVIEGDVRARVVMAAARETFRRLFKLEDDASYARVSPSDWATFRASQRPPPGRDGPACHPGGSDTALLPDGALVERTRQYIRDNDVRHFTLTGERLTFDRAAALVVRDMAARDPALLRSYIDQPGEVN
jgi:hypothetical protein